MSPDAWFVPIAVSQRNDALAAYAAHLAVRDGIPDVSGRILPQRQETLTRFGGERHLFKGRIDPERFATHMYAAYQHRPSASLDLPADLLFVFTCVRANTYEAYAVEHLLATVDSAQDTMRQRTNLIIMLEEYYHTSFLLSIADLFDLTVPAPAPPPFVVRALIAGLAHLPNGVAHPLTLCSEIIGLALFVKLFELAGTVFAAEPALREAIEVRLGEVIADELGHISYNRLHLGRSGLKMAQWLLPRVANGTRYGMPGAAGLGLYPFPSEAIQDLQVHRLPRFILDHAFIA